MTTTRTYPENWRDVSRAAKIAASWTCEVCGLVCDESGNALPDQPRSTCADGRATKLTTHHINDDTFDNRPENLLVCCQFCHLAVEHWLPGYAIPKGWAWEFWAWIRARNLPHMIAERLFEHV